MERMGVGFVSCWNIGACVSEDDLLSTNRRPPATDPYLSAIRKFTVGFPLSSTATFFSHVRGGVKTGRSTRLSVSTSKVPSWRVIPQPSYQATISYSPGGTFVSSNFPLSWLPRSRDAKRRASLRSSRYARHCMSGLPNLVSAFDARSPDWGRETAGCRWRRHPCAPCAAPHPNFSFAIAYSLLPAVCVVRSDNVSDRART